MSGQEDRHIGREAIRLLMRPVLPACGTMVHRLEEGAKQLRTAAARAASANPAIDSTQPDSGSSAFADPACRAPADTGGFRSEERRVGKEFVSTGQSRWSPFH